MLGLISALRLPSESDLQNHGDHVEIRGAVQSSWELLQYGKNAWLRLCYSIGMIALSGVAVMVSARLLGTFVERIQAGAPAEAVLTIGAAVLGLECLSVWFQYLGRVGLAVATNRIVLAIRSELFSKLERLPMSYFDRQPHGRTITRLTNDVEGIEEFFGGTLARLLTAMVNIVIVFVAMLVTNLKFGAVVVASSIPAIVFTVALRGPVRDWLRSYKRKSAHTNAVLAEFLNGLGVIKAFGLENWSLQRYRQVVEELLHSGVNLLNWNSFIRPLAMLLCTLPLLAILWYGGYGVIGGTLSLGLVVAFVRFSERFSQPIRIVSQEVQVVQEALTSSERLRQLLNEPEEKDELGVDGQEHWPIDGAVEYSLVSMAYNPRQPILQDVSFTAATGDKVALVGATGSGKTTTLSLLSRLYEFQSGVIRIDGHDIRDFNRRFLRSQLGLVTQDVVVFRGTLRENLRGATQGEGNDEALISDEFLLEACRKTGLILLVERIPKGLDAFLYEGGENLSMGERQVLAFTRMLIRDPRILILDEATANVDETCEKLIQRATHESLKDRTCFVIAHRLSTILQCNRILVFSGGQIVEQGSHSELMALGGHYRSLIHKQLGSL